MVAINSDAEAFAILEKYGITPPPSMVYLNSLQGMPIQEYIATQCYLEKNVLMPTWPHVDLLLDLALYPEKYGYPHWSTILWSTIKKSIKTTLSSVVCKWVLETFPGSQECIFLASDAEQASGRGFKMFRELLEKSPYYNADKKAAYSPYGDKLWDVTQRLATFLPDGSFVKPVSSDFSGEAGGNPTASFFTELWSWRMRKDEKLYTEMQVPPTRPKGFRWLDSYAGYTGESNVLWKIWQRLQREGRQLTTDDIPQWGVLFPNEYKLPVWVHYPSRSFGYIDQGVLARRFPWQQGPVGDAYYIQERASATTESDYLRLNENMWSEPTQALMPIQWWDNSKDLEMRDIRDNEAVIVSIDASMTHDCSAMILVTRHPEHHEDIVIRKEAVFDPLLLGELNYDTTLLPQLVEWARIYNIVSIVFDKYQLKYLMDRVNSGTCGDIPMADGSIARLRALPVRSFNQQSERMESDSMFVTMVRDRRIHHDGSLTNLRDHILNANGKLDMHENTKLHIIKRDTESKIDAVVAASMACKEALDLSI